MSGKCDEWRSPTNLFREGREGTSISTTVVREALNPSVPVSLSWGVLAARGEPLPTPTGGLKPLIHSSLGVLGCRETERQKVPVVSQKGPFLRLRAGSLSVGIATRDHPSHNPSQNQRLTT